MQIKVTGRPGYAVLSAALMTVCALFVTACGGGASVSSPTPTPSPSPKAPAAYCAAFSQYQAISDQLTQQFDGSPDLAMVKSLIARLASTIDGADENAPPSTKADLDTLRAAVDTMDSTVQSATTLLGAEAAVATVSGQEIAAASDRVAQATIQTCGFTPSSPTPS